MTSSSRTRSSPFGTVTQLPSGQWRARYPAPNGKRPGRTFGTKTDARVWLATVQADALRGVLGVRKASSATVGDYAAAYMARDIRPSTRSLYEQVWRTHLAATWTDVLVTDIDAAQVRDWHSARRRAKTGPSALAQAYRMLRGLLNLAIHDEVIDINPCKIKGASTVKRSKPVQILTIAQVNQLAASSKMPDHLKAFVLVLAYMGARYGEASALRRKDVAPDYSSIHIERAQRKGLVGLPKSEAGIRDIAAPEFVQFALYEHLATYTGEDPDDLLFGTKSGKFMASQNWAKVMHRALAHEQLPRIRTHDLRHTGATLAAHTGASTKELMFRFGHSSMKAAIVYQHAAEYRDREIADALNLAITAASGHA
jgi:integrase